MQSKYRHKGLLSGNIHFPEWYMKFCVYHFLGTALYKLIKKWRLEKKYHIWIDTTWYIKQIINRPYYFSIVMNVSSCYKYFMVS